MRRIKFSILIIIHCAHLIIAQNTVNLQQCLDSAKLNNYTLKGESILLEYQKILSKTNWNIGKTNIAVQYGQYNGVFNDNALHISQNFLNPAYYLQQKNIYDSEYRLQELSYSLEKKNLEITLLKLFYDLVINNEKIKLIKELDSILLQCQNKVRIQKEMGDIDIMEKEMINRWYQENNIQLKALIFEKQKQLLLLELLTQIKPISDILYNEIKLPSDLNLKDTSEAIHQHLSIQIETQKQLVQYNKVKLEKSKLLPDFFISYSNQSLRGWGTDNIYYPSSHRFQFIQAGLEIPVFIQSFSNKIKAEKKLLNYHQIQTQFQKQKHTFNIQKTISEYKNLINITENYEKNILPGSDKIKEYALNNYLKGNIHFTQFSLLINQSINTKINYLNYVFALNQSIIDLKYYLSTY